MAKRFIDESVGGDKCSPVIRSFGPAWRRQTWTSESSYQSPDVGRSIWTDRVRRYDRQPELLAGRDAAKYKRDCCGNRVRQKDPVMAARAELQRRGIKDRQFRAWLDTLTPAEFNWLVGRVAKVK